MITIYEEKSNSWIYWVVAIIALIFGYFYFFTDDSQIEFKQGEKKNYTQVKNKDDYFVKSAYNNQYFKQESELKEIGKKMQESKITFANFLNEDITNIEKDFDVSCKKSETKYRCIDDAAIKLMEKMSTEENVFIDLSKYKTNALVNSFVLSYYRAYQMDCVKFNNANSEECASKIRFVNNVKNIILTNRAYIVQNDLTQEKLENDGLMFGEKDHQYTENYYMTFHGISTKYHAFVLNGIIKNGQDSASFKNVLINFI